MLKLLLGYYIAFSLKIVGFSKLISNFIKNSCQPQKIAGKLSKHIIGFGQNKTKALKSTGNLSKS
jgi:hypothetical protein